MFRNIVLIVVFLTLQILFGTADDEICVDLNDQCPGMAAGGDCDSDSRYMFNNCRLSCNLCHCVDDHPKECRGMAAVGKCKKKEFKEQMIMDCPQSCHQCKTAHGYVVV